MLSRSRVEKSFYLFSRNRPMTASSLFQLKMLTCFMLGNRTLNTGWDWRIKWRKHNISLGFLSLQSAFTQLNCLLLFKQQLPLFRRTERYKLFIWFQHKGMCFISVLQLNQKKKKENSPIELLFWIIRMTFPHSSYKCCTIKQECSKMCKTSRKKSSNYGF